MYVPRKRAVLDGFLAVLAPPVAVLEVVDLALGHEREPWLPRPLLALHLPLVGRPACRRPTWIHTQTHANMHYYWSINRLFKLSNTRTYKRAGLIKFERLLLASFFGRCVCVRATRAACAY
jgi:hypothetical protein